MVECNSAGNYLSEEDRTDVYAAVLARQTPTLFFNGQYDLICNTEGTGRFLRKLNYGDWMYQKSYIWSIATGQSQSQSQGGGRPGQQVQNEEIAGYAQTSSDGILTYLKVLGASHMVPYDQPE